MSTNIPAAVQLAANEYIDLVRQALPGLLEGLYIHGSVALAAFTPGLSDIDAITITSWRCSPSDISALREVHQTLSQRRPDVQWEGSYLQWQDLGRFEDTIPAYPHVHDGIVHASGYHDINAVTWWVLKHRGIAVIGPPAHQLGFDVDWERLVADMHHNMNTYWARFTSNPRRIAWLLSDYGIQWAVLGVLRQFYTFREHAITSKTGAGLYALQHTPARWHRLIQEAINIRAGMPGSSYRFRTVRALAARAFLQHVIAECNSKYG